MRTSNRLLLTSLIAFAPMAAAAADSAISDDPEVSVHTKSDRTIQEYH